MEQDAGFDEPEFGASTGDARANDPSLPGFTANDPLFRSHFQHANRLADREYEHVRPAYRLGFDAAGPSRFADKSFDEAGEDLQGAGPKRASPAARGRRGAATPRKDSGPAATTATGTAPACSA